MLQIFKLYKIKKCLSLFFAFMLLFFFLSVFPEQNSISKELSQFQITGLNRSVMICGSQEEESIYSSLDIMSILAIANFISNEPVPLTTNWNLLDRKTVMLSSIQDKEKFEKLAPDMKRIIFICTAWDESLRLNIFSVPLDALENIKKNVRKQRPWKIYSASVASQIDRLSDKTIIHFIDLILRSDIFYSVRGNFERNSTLQSTPFKWLL